MIIILRNETKRYEIQNRNHRIFNSNKRIMKYVYFIDQCDYIATEHCDHCNYEDVCFNQ